MTISLILILTAVHVYGSAAVSEPVSFPFPNVPSQADPRCPPMGLVGICAFTCTDGCRPDRICCPTACGGTVCKKPVSLPDPNPLPTPCPPDVPMAFCTFIPCEKETCPNHPQAKCVDNYCGGCNAKFYLNGRDVTNTCKQTRSLPKPCKDGKPRVNCFLNPCDVQQCPLFPRATCVADYCGGCNARFFFNEKEVTTAL
ncbi:kielin/chordin-like protein [Ylistrum balloti]|uniref:kielin/chordin-like protein n=1 Tax=Ylistrum balloti TaxID=509963 RepID=UPI002905EFB2|nr:kielin/chordin-like protein [Ylistrum balloti]